MKRLAMLLVFGSGCAATPMIMVAADAHSPSAMVVAPVHIDNAAPSSLDRLPLIDGMRRAGMQVADDRPALQPPDAAILSARISSLSREVTVPPIGDKWRPFDPGVTFEWVHYQVELRLTDAEGHLLARAVGQVNDGARQSTELHHLLRTMAAQMAAGLPTAHSPVLAQR